MPYPISNYSNWLEQYGSKNPESGIGLFTSDLPIKDKLLKLLTAGSDLPGPQGMVINPKNALILREIIKKSLVGQLQPSTNTAIDYIRAKYPLLSSKSSYIRSADISDLGEFNPLTEGINIQNVGPIKTIYSKINTLGHELTHLLQNLRGKFYDWKVPYELRESEQLAKRGGNTAENTFMKLLTLLNNLDYPGTKSPPRNFTEIIKGIKP